MKVQKQDWRSFEQLAERIYRKLEPDAIVKHDDSIYGHDSGTQRQIDVSIRKEVAGHEILVVVQARDRKRAPNVNDVGEFATVIKDVQASKGVMVCRKPPGKNAATLAKAHGIEMCSAFDVNDHKWKEDVAVPVVVRLAEGNLTPLLSFASGGQWNISLPPKPEPGYVSTDAGQTQETLLDYMIRLVSERGEIKDGADEFVSADTNLCILLSERDWVPVPLFGVKVTASVRSLFRHCRADEYLALMNYSTGKLNVAEMKLELPPFHDTYAWADAHGVNIAEEAKQHVPVVDLRISLQFKNSGFGLRLLPLEVLEEERVYLLQSQDAAT